MATAFSTTGKTLAFLPLVGVASSPLAQAAELPFPSLSPFPNQPQSTSPSAQWGQADAVASPLRPLADSMSVEVGAPQFIAQVVPTDGATQSRVDAAGNQFDISGGIKAGENLFHRLERLDLEAGQTANFQTPAGLEAVLTQVSGGPSSIDGRLKVSGSSADLFLLNPQGVVFGPNAQLDLNGSFTATTADRVKVGDQWVDLLEEGVTAQTAAAGAVEALEFSADAAGGAIANQAQLAVTDGESLRLLGNAVVNTGSLTAPGGEVAVLSASGGQQVSLGGGLLNMELAAPGATNAEHRLAPVVAQPVAEATGLRLNADGSVSLQAGQTVVSGEVDVASAQAAGGQVKILGEDVQVTDAVVDASGTAGGEILVGGDYQGRGDILRAVQTRLDEASVLRADGVAGTSNIRPDGGEVVVWSDGTAEFAGTATARSLASGGDGGLVETSGKQQLNIAAAAYVNTTAVDGATGQWLIDPVDLTVVNGGGSGSIVGGVNDSGASTIDAATVEAGLNGNNVQLQADNSITIDVPLNASANVSGGDLNLDSPNLNLNERIILRSGSELSGTATTVNVGVNGGIQNAVDASIAGGTVNLAAGTYHEGREIVVDKQIRLQGQGASSTTISGDANRDGNALGNQTDNHRVLNIRSGADGSVFSGITVSDAIRASDGAGLRNVANDVTIENSIFSNNQTLGAVRDGGAIHSQGDRLQIDNTRFENNYARGNGGAIDILSGSAEISNSAFITNKAAQGHGGAIDLDLSGSLAISNSSFERNSAGTDGGAVYASAAVNITDGSFTNNAASGAGGAIFVNDSLSFGTSRVQNNTASLGGGGIALAGTGGTASISSTTVHGNTALGGAGGGLMHMGGQTTTITDSTFSSNVASGAWNGGALDLFPVVGGTTVLIQNSTLSSNRGGNFGGALSQAGSVQTTLNNVTVANNTADNGGGLANPFGGSLNLQNTIVAQNTATTDADVTGPITSFGNNIVQQRGTSTGYAGADLPDGTDPLLLSLADNGGLTETHAIRATSLAVNGGSASATSADQRGLAAVNQRDIGAYELDNDLTFAVTGSGQTQTVNQAFANPVDVTVTDSLGAVVAGLDIDVTTPVAGASASLGTLQTNSNGVASATATANTIAGSYTVNLGITSNSSLGTVALTNRPDAPNQIAVLNGNNQSTVVNTAFANPLQVAVTDQFGNQIPFQAVAVNLPGSGASAAASNGLDLNAIALTTDVFGQATIGLTANTIAGSYPVGLTAGAITNGINLTNLPDVPAQLAVTSGNNQSTVVNTAFANPLQVSVTDQFGNAISGATVNLNLPTTGASAAAGAVSLTTDAAGQANTSITANTIAGNYAVGLTSGSLSGSASLANLPDAPAQLAVANGDNQSTIVNTAFANPLQVAVTDQFGNAISGATVNLNLPTTGASAVAGAVSLTTDAAGQASTSISANTVAGGYTVGLTSGTLSHSASLTNLPDAPAQLSIDSGDSQSTIVNTSFANPLQVTVTDQFGNAISGATVNVNLPGSGSSANAGAIALTTDPAGQAATSLTANTIAGNYTVGLTSGSLSNSASLTNLPDAPAQLDVVTGDDQSTLVNTAFADNISIQVADQYGNSIPNVTVTFTGPITGASTTNPSFSLQTNALGQGQTAISANNVSGAYQLLASAGILAQAVSLENLPEPPTPTPPAPTPPIPAPTPLPTPTPSGPVLPVAPPTQIDQPGTPPPSSQAIDSPDVKLSGPAPLSLVDGSAIASLDASFSSEYASYWGTEESSGVTIAETRDILQQAEDTYGVRSAVLYALFVPQEQAADEGFGEVQVANMALNRRTQTQTQRDDDQLMLVLVPNEGSPIQRLIDVTRKEVLRQAKLFRLAVSDPEDEQSYKPLAQQMHGWMFAPIETELERLDLDHVMYAADVGLRTLPLVAMMDGDDFVIERYGISQIPSVDLLETDFGASQPSAQTLAAGATEFEQMNDLPAVALELDAIAKGNTRNSNHSNPTVDVLLNESFTPANLSQAQQASGVTNLHLATHGEFNSGDISRSFLQFWDGPLGLDEVSDLSWNELELLILSACQTAISSPEAELGFAGLAAAMGVESTIGSLWSVSDIGTLALMSEFYGQLAQEPLRFESLRQAQLSMRRGETAIMKQALRTNRGEIELPQEWVLPEQADFSHPFYWSGFSLVGNPWW